MVQEADYFASQLNLFETCDAPPMDVTPVSSSGRTFPEPFHPIEGWIFEPCLKKSQRPKFQCLNLDDGRMPEWCEAVSVRPHGASLTLNIGAYPNAAAESSLSQILQPMEDVPQKYYLSRKAILGILRRAKERGKELPAELVAALKRQAGLMVSTQKPALQTTRQY